VEYKVWLRGLLKQQTRQREECNSGLGIRQQTGRYTKIKSMIKGLFKQQAENATNRGVIQKFINRKKHSIN